MDEIEFEFNDHDDTFSATQRFRLVPMERQRHLDNAVEWMNDPDVTRWTVAGDSDIDVIVVAPTKRPFVERFRDYLPAILDAGIGVDLLVYTPEEFTRMRAEGRPFFVDALADARQVYVGTRERKLSAGGGRPR